MAGYINIHTHRAGNPGALEIVSFYADFERADAAVYCSVGLHPWYLDAATMAQQSEQLRLLACRKNVLAIGECGLDKITDTDWALQLAAFTAQITLANALQKPLIIHCVRAYEELLAVFRKHPAQVPVIVHGFNKKPELAQRLLDAGFYLSFGKALTVSETTIAAFLHTPPDRFFLETDAADIDIAAIYEAAAACRKTGVDTIISQAQNNFQQIFRI